MDEVAATTSSRPALDFASSTAMSRSYRTDGRRRLTLRHEEHKGHEDHENQTLLVIFVCFVAFVPEREPWARLSRWRYFAISGAISLLSPENCCRIESKPV